MYLNYETNDILKFFEIVSHLQYIRSLSDRIVPALPHSCALNFVKVVKMDQNSAVALFV